MKFLENLFGSNKEEKQKKIFRERKKSIENFLCRAGYQNIDSEECMNYNDEELIEKSGGMLMNIIFKHYPRFKSSMKREYSGIEGKREKKESVCNLAVSLNEFFGLYLENPRLRGMDYGIADKNLPVYNPDAPENEQNALSEKEQFIIYEEKLANGINDIELKDIQNYSISYACRIVEDYSKEFLKYINKKSKEIIQTANSIRLIDRFKKETFKELSDTLKNIPRIQNIPNINEQMDFIKKILKRYESEKQKLIKAGISEHDIPGKNESRKLWDFVAKKCRKPETKAKQSNYLTPATGMYIADAGKYQDPFETFKKTKQLKK